MNADEINARLLELELQQKAVLAVLITLTKHLPAAHADLRLLAQEAPHAPVEVPDRQLQVFADTIRAVLRDPGVNPWR